MKKEKFVQSVLAFCFIALLFLLPTKNVEAGVLSEVPDENFVQTNGTVYDLEISSDNTMYIGGNFSRVDKNNGKGIPISLNTGLKESVFPKVNGVVRSSEPDGSGGWFIGGEFTKVGNVVRNHIAHILPDGTVDMDWDANSNGSVQIIKLSGDTLYVGGWFAPFCGGGSSIGGEPRNKVAALDANTGNALSWNPDIEVANICCNYIQVDELVITNTLVYIGGQFGCMGGQERQNLAAVDRITGEATAWNPSPNNVVTSLMLYDNTMFVGGIFDTIGGQIRQSLAAVNVDSGLANTWNPSPQNNLEYQTSDGISPAIHYMIHDGTNFYVGGLFKEIFGQDRHGLASFNLNSMELTSWNPEASMNYEVANACYPEDYGFINSLQLLDDTIIVGGSFNNIGGYDRHNLAEISLTNALATDWDPDVWSSVDSISKQGSIIYVGGFFDSIGGQVRNSLAEIDLETGEATAWNPNIQVSSELNNPMKNISLATIYDIEIDSTDDTVYVGGDFATIGGLERNGLAALIKSSGEATAWNPNAIYTNDGLVGDLAMGYERSNGIINDLEIHKATNQIYVGGDFEIIGGQLRNNAASVDMDNGIASEWNPNAEYPIKSLLIHNSRVYVGGQFTTIGGESNSHFAALDIGSGIVLDWGPDVDGEVLTMTIDNDTMYVGGSFTHINGVLREYAGAINIIDGSLTGWDPKTYTFVDSIEVSDDRIFMDGLFEAGGLSCTGDPLVSDTLVAVDKNNGQTILWTGNIGRAIFSIKKKDSKLFAGGMEVLVVYGEHSISTINGDDLNSDNLFLSGASIKRQFFAYSKNLRGGFNIASGNVTAGGEAEIVVGAGDGFGPQVQIFNSNGELQVQFWAYASHLRTGVRVAIADVDGDGKNEIITSPGVGGRPHIRIFKGNGELYSHGFFALDGKFSGGVFVSGGDTDGDGIDEIVVSAGQGGGPHVMVYNNEGRVLANFMAYDQNFRGGIKTTLADVDGDGKDEIITGPEFGAPHIQIFQIRPNEIKRLSPGFYAFDPGYRGGVSLAGVDIDGNGKKEIVVSAGIDAQPLVKIYNIREQLLRQFYVYATSFIGGVNISGGDVDYDGADELIVIPRSSGGPQVRIINVDAI